MSDVETTSGGSGQRRPARLDSAAISARLGAMDGWATSAEGHLVKTYKFPDFLQALAFVNRAGTVAERQGHHPDLHLGWGRVTVEIWTHAVGGITELDFVLAEGIDAAK